MRRGAAGNLQPRPRRAVLCCVESNSELGAVTGTMSRRWRGAPEISTQVVRNSCRRRGDLLVGLAGRHILRVRILLDVRHRRRALGYKLAYS